MPTKCKIANRTLTAQMPTANQARRRVKFIPVAELSRNRVKKKITDEIAADIDKT